MEELLKALPSLLGVLIGGLITFFVQNTTVRKQQKWEARKIEIDIYYKEQTLKFQTFNKILQLNRFCNVLEYDIHYGPELNEKNYRKHIRPLLFDIFHLLENSLAKDINNIEEIYERQHAVGEEYSEDKKALSESYQNIIKSINGQFKLLRESKHLSRGHKNYS
ncbi:hypothetical protein GZ22_16875 [Terribacillus saccharophilus]|uniref:Uncharacterized protein n=1 Tax=Terribacillus saccharophilus TaxID=361277 RepID=A0A075LP61_9BACI|nr:hypothetical protein [Terribacillus goriensis]AIF68139.1 hypothetical protein GZ22_16875 [Terribacillus goriensis]